MAVEGPNDVGETALPKKANSAPKPKDTPKPKAKKTDKNVDSDSAKKVEINPALKKQKQSSKTSPEDFAKKEIISFTTNVPHNASWLVYLNGLEVQATAVSVQFGVWQIPTAQVTLPPHVMLQRLGFEDRIMVTIFYLDEFYAPANPRYCLMGEFELVEWSYMNTGSGRAIRLSCRSPLQIFEQLKFYYMSSLDDIVTANMNVGASASDTVTTAVVLYPQSLFHNGLVPIRSDRSEEPDALDFITSPSGFIWNIFKALTGDIDFPSVAAAPENDFVPQQACAIPGRNFFGRWMFKTQFYRRWVGLYGLDDGSSGATFPLLDANNNTQVVQALQQQIGISVGSAGTAWELLQKVLGLMLMEINTTPAPPAGQVDALTRTYGGEFFSKGTKKSPSYGALYTHYVKPQCLFAIPPTCNIIFPSMITSYSFAENYMAQPTRVYLGEQFLNDLLTRTNNGEAIRTQTSKLLSTGYPQAVKLWMQAYITAPEQNTKNFLLFPEEFYRGPIAKHLSAPPWTFMLDEYYKAFSKKDEDKDLAFVEEGPPLSGKGSSDVIDPASTPIISATTASWHKAKANVSDLNYGNIKTRRDIMFVYKKWAQEYVGKVGLPASAVPFILATMAVESGGEADVKNDQNFLGLTQIGKRFALGTTYASAATKKKNKKNKVPPVRGFLDNLVERYKVFTPEEAKARSENLFDPSTNIACACAHLANGFRALRLSASAVNIEHLNLTSPKGPNDAQLLVAYYAEPGNAFRLQASVRNGVYAPNKVTFKNESVDTDNTSGKQKDMKGLQYWEFRSKKLYTAWQELQGMTDVGEAVTVSASSPAVANGNADSLQSLSVNKDSNYSTDEEYQQLQAQATAQSQSTTSVFGSGTPVTQSIPASSSSIDYSGTEKTKSSLLGGVFDLYAKYEYFRARYEPRSANVTLAFDPYIVPGFPAVVFDSRIAKMDIVGYVMSVAHSWDAESPSISTDVTMSYVRSFPEFLGVYKNGDLDVDLDGYLALGAVNNYRVYPRDPVAEVAKYTQTYEVDSLYGFLFYPNNKDNNREKFFDFEEMLDVYTAAGKKVDNLDSWTWEDGMFVNPKSSYAKLFTSYDTAMKYVARPVATIEDFVQLRGGKTVEELLAYQAEEHKKAGTVVEASTESDVMNSNYFHLGEVTNTERGAKYYSRIYGLLQGPLTDINAVTFGNITGINYYAVRDNYQTPIMASSSWTNSDIDIGIPDTRKNWDKVLRRYRQIIRGKKLQT